MKRHSSVAHLLPSILCFLGCTVLLPLCGCVSRPSSHTAEWRPLFNGADLTGWTVKCQPADRKKVFWTVYDGMIQADSLGFEGHDYVWLVTNEEYANFVLRLRFQAYRTSPGNSGVQIRSRYDDEAGWLDGPQIDIHPAGPWRTGMIWDETRGVQHWLCPTVPKGQWVNQAMAQPELTFYYADDEPAWNTLEIRAIDTRISVILNGVVVTDYDGTDVLDDAIHAERNVGLKGHIALQIHRNDQLKIRFKDITILELPAP